MAWDWLCSELGGKTSGDDIMTNEQYRQFLFQAEQARNAYLRRTFSRTMRAIVRLFPVKRFPKTA